MNLNDLAIILTKKIESDLVYEYMQKGKDRTPSFYNIRETILKFLTEYMDVVAVEIKDSPMMYKQMPPGQQKSYRDYQLEQKLIGVVGEIFKSKDFVETYEYKDEYDMYRSQTSYLCVLKTAKIQREAREVKP